MDGRELEILSAEELSHLPRLVETVITDAATVQDNEEFSFLQKLGFKNQDVMSEKHKKSGQAVVSKSNLPFIIRSPPDVVQKSQPSVTESQTPARTETRLFNVSEPQLHGITPGAVMVSRVQTVGISQEQQQTADEQQRTSDTTTVRYSNEMRPQPSIVSQFNPIAEQPRPLRDPPPSYFRLAVFVTIFCCFAVGLVAVSKAIQTKKAVVCGNFKEAKESSRWARRLSLIAILVGIIIIFISVVVGIVMYELGHLK